jgi:hypothetical protein
MVKRYGSLVGAVKQTVPVQLVDQAYERIGQEVLVRDTITLAAAAIGDTFQCAVLGWETVLDPFDCYTSNAALGATTTLSLGDVTFPTALDNAVATNAAAQKQACSAVGIGNYGQPLWQLLGYASLAAAKAEVKARPLPPNGAQGPFSQ